MGLGGTRIPKHITDYTFQRTGGALAVHPRPTPKPRTKISRTPIAPANTPVTARSVLDESLSTELSDCPTTSAEAKQSDDKQEASEEKLEKGKDAPQREDSVARFSPTLRGL